MRSALTAFIGSLLILAASYPVAAYDTGICDGSTIDFDLEYLGHEALFSLVLDVTACDPALPPIELDVTFERRSPTDEPTVQENHDPCFEGTRCERILAIAHPDIEFEVDYIGQYEYRADLGEGRFTVGLATIWMRCQIGSSLARICLPIP